MGKGCNGLEGKTPLSAPAVLTRELSPAPCWKVGLMSINHPHHGLVDNVSELCCSVVCLFLF